jgi:hypothetical protein
MTFIIASHLRFTTLPLTFGGQTYLIEEIKEKSMSSAIEVQSPVIVPQKMFNEVWLSKLSIVAKPEGICQIQATVDLARDNGDGTKELAPVSQRKYLNVPNFFAEATADEMAIMYQVVAMISNRLGL